MDPTRSQRTLRAIRVAAVLAVLSVLLIAYHLGILQQFAEPARAKQTLLALGPRGYAAFILAYAMLQPFGVPGTAFIMAAPLIWSWPVAFALSMTGTMAASTVGFSFARFVARDFVAARIPARFQRYNDALSRRAFATVAVLRFVFWMPPLLHAFFGVSQVRFSTHFWGSLLGYLTPVFLVSFFGERLFDWLRAAPLSLWIGLGVGAALLGLAIWLLRRRPR